MVFVIFKTNKKQGNSKYKRKSKLIIIITFLSLQWCIRDWYEVAVTIDEKIPYVIVIPIFVFILFSQTINTWFNVIVGKKLILLWDRMYGIKFINREKIKNVDITDGFIDTKKQARFWGFKLNDISDVLITMNDGSVFVIHCQTPEKLYKKLNSDQSGETNQGKTNQGTVL